MAAQDVQVAVTAPQHAELVDAAPPEAPLGPREVFGRTVASLVSPGTELNACYLPGGGRPGYAAVCAVEAVGAEVSDLAPGDLVFGRGPHRSWQRDQRDRLLPVPAGLDAATACFARLMGVSLTTLVTTTARPPGPVAVAGLGPVGHLAALNFQAAGYQVLGIDPSAARRELAAARGIATTPTAPLGDAAWQDRFALAMDASGHEQAVLDLCGLVRKRGEVVLIATPWVKRTEASAHALLHVVFHRYVVLRSGWEWELPDQPREFTTGSITGSLSLALDWLASGRVQVDGLAETVSPRDCDAAYAALRDQRGSGLSVVFDWQALA